MQHPPTPPPPPKKKKTTHPMQFFNLEFISFCIFMVRYSVLFVLMQGSLVGHLLLIMWMMLRGSSKKPLRTGQLYLPCLQGKKFNLSFSYRCKKAQQLSYEGWIFFYCITMLGHYWTLELVQCNIFSPTPIPTPFKKEKNCHHSFSSVFFKDIFSIIYWAQRTPTFGLLTSSQVCV